MTREENRPSRGTRTAQKSMATDRTQSNRWNPRWQVHTRTETRTIRVFECWRCHKEQVFTWRRAWCDADRHLLCGLCADYALRCADYALRLCRRCKEPRRDRVAGDWKASDFYSKRTAYPTSGTICNRCLIPDSVNTPVTRECSHCGEGFTPGRSDARYCSTRCRVAAHRNRRSNGQQRHLSESGVTVDGGATQNTLVRWSPPDPLPPDAIAAAMCACHMGDVAVPALIRRLEAIA